MKKIVRAPYLKNKDPREKDTVYLPDILVHGLRQIAKKEGKSLSYVVQEILIEWTGVEIEYYEKKNKKNRRSK